MKNLLLASMFFAIGFILTSCGAESVSSLVPPPTLSVGAGTGSEGGNIAFTVSLSSTAVSAVTFKYRTEIGTGYTAEQADFTAITEADGIISIGETTTTIEVITDYDNEDDGNETFGLVLSSVSGALLAGGGTILTTKGTIINNNNVAPLPTLSVGAGTGGEGGNITFTVSLSSTAVSAVTFSYATELDGTADENDLVQVMGEATILAGNTTVDIVVVITDDTDDDDDETFGLVLSAVSGAVFSPAGDTLTAIGTITDNDLPLPTLSVGAGIGGETSGNVVFTVSLSETSADATTFKYRTEIGTGYTTDQADFTAIGAVGAEMDGMIAAGSTTLDIVVVITEDTDDDDDETFGLVLSAVSGAVFSPAGSTLTAIGTITDNDLPLPTLSIGAGTGGETPGNVAFTVSLSSTADKYITFSYATELDGTADENDLVQVMGEATIHAGSTALSIRVVITDDTDDDDDETFSLVLSAVSGAVFSPAGDTLTAIGTITDNDLPPPTLSVGAGTGGETSGEVVFTVSLSEILTEAATFKYRTEIGTGDTADQADFTAIGAVGTEMDGMIATGNTTVDIVVVITEDTIAEGDNTFSLVLSDVSGVIFAGGGTTLTATGTITDNDVADGNGLLDIDSAAKLANIRYNLAGTSYKTSSTDAGG